ncbi:DNA mismatch repair endonuclease MutL [Tenuifilum thalassicum]|uniref:DNA mismatch repair protein MutL n=1 Tax=Tenuifilum thalassicum TaxID=2590900 RepID=A0A7D4CSA2_9BACT|nr:DNA mismatch repair endonuclease MutL [Tenuifilum thalassicum]QKG80705.1 DNA mismatch repair endonuclease MutL [Tenuifilum thalassicum]
MADVIQLLPDSIANQIAAGEVVQRPASVVKELLENSIDAGARNITLIVREGGKSLIQVIDDGIGMSETDARLCFERHATSKIRTADDLFNIRTMGFRGEALASIAAVAEVELKTRRTIDEVGTEVNISASELVSQQPIACQAGTQISIKNLFFNVPARRKFLKSDSVELKHIISEFQRVSLAYPEVAFTLNHNGNDLYKLPPSGLKQRIVGLFGKNINQHLIDISTQTSIVKLGGYIGKPECAKKSAGEQFFFVNGRFMKNPFLHKAIMNAYDRLLPSGAYPSYFIYFDIDPQSIDVNIHPTKTEIKFEDERMIWQILHAAVRESLGKFSVTPSIDFDTPGFDIPYLPKNAPITFPSIDIDPTYNPFDEQPKGAPTHKSGGNKQSVTGWEQLFGDMPEEPNPVQTRIETFESEGMKATTSDTSNRFYQLKGKYILTNVKSGLMIIDQKRAHERILYEQYMAGMQSNTNIKQKELFPKTIELLPADYELLISNADELAKFGMEISNLNHNTISVNSLPASSSVTDPAKLIENLLAIMNENHALPFSDAKHRIALSMAKASAIGYGKVLSNFEMQEIVDKLFACSEPNITPDGKKIIDILELDEIERRLK